MHTSSAAEILGFYKHIINTWAVSYVEVRSKWVGKREKIIEIWDVVEKFKSFEVAWKMQENGCFAGVWNYQF